MLHKEFWRPSDLLAGPCERTRHSHDPLRRAVSSLEGERGRGA